MARRSRRTMIKAFFSRLFPSQGVKFSPNGVEGHTGLGGVFFPSARNFVLENPTMIYNAQSENDKVTWAMKILSQRIIPGVAHDSSARVPPPRCHPGTRIKLNERITSWFYDQARQKLLLWLNGPAGVGKSAVIQTLAGHLAKSKRLGASLFFSRPNKRNDPQRVFITVAYQLAVRIEEYRVFISEQLAIDPQLLDKEMNEQFRILIFEPFVEKRIGTGGEVWGVLLDGLDELEGQRAQRDIIRLISTFVCEHSEVPLVWVIASRPELHISETFGEEEIMPSYWEEFIPIDSTEACEDVERFLRSSFKTIRKEFPRSAPKDWPSEAKFLKLANAASGLFVYASVVVRFVEDADYANPVARLDVVLSAIDRSEVVLPENQPFAHLDALYTQILVSIPQASWPIAKRVLGFALCARGSDLTNFFEFYSNNLKGMSVILNLEQGVIYASLSKCYSVLQIPPPKSAYSTSMTFFHASFADYLTDLTRSKDFHICLDDAINDVTQCLIRILRDFVENLPITSEGRWPCYCSQYHSVEPRQTSGKMKKQWNGSLYVDVRSAFFYMVTGSLHVPRGERTLVLQRGWSRGLDLLVQFGILDLRLSHWSHGFVRWLYKIWKEYPEELTNRGLIRRVRLRELKLQHLDRKLMFPSYFDESTFSGRVTYTYPGSRKQLRGFISMLKSFQRQSPELEVLIFGIVPENRYAFFYYEHSEQDAIPKSLFIRGKGYYVIPSPY